MTIEEELLKQTKEGNKVIVKFMGGVREWDAQRSAWIYRFSGDDVTNIEYGSYVSVLYEDDLCYNGSWQHLMSACTKINRTIPIPENKEGNHLYTNVFEGLFFCIGIMITFLEVSNFLNWYNKQPKP